jgi:hypothetical protein
MANPGPYPMGPAMGGPMQPMGGPPMGGPMGMMPRRAVRQGTSRVVPVVVSAGLAIGVFCGLLFGLGTGERGVIEQPKVSNNAKANDDFTPETLARPDIKTAKGSAAVAANAGSNAAGSNAGSADGSNAAAAPPVDKPVKLIVEITPENVAKTAKVYVDDKPLEGTSTDIPLDPGTDKKKVKIVVKAPGYKDVVQETDAEGESVTVKVELSSRGRSTLAGTDAAAPATGTPATGTPATGTPATGTPATGTPASATGATGPGSPASTGTRNTGGNRNTGTKSNKAGKGSGGLIDI